jgi:hypothetical protein
MSAIDPEAQSTLPGNIDRGRYWDRTSDLFGVNKVRPSLRAPAVTYWLLTVLASVGLARNAMADRTRSSPRFLPALGLCAWLFLVASRRAGLAPSGHATTRVNRQPPYHPSWAKLVRTGATADAVEGVTEIGG